MVPQFFLKNENSSNHTHQCKIKSARKITSGNDVRACNKKIWYKESCCEKWCLNRHLTICKNWQWTLARWEGERWVFQSVEKSVLKIFMEMSLSVRLLKRPAWLQHVWEEASQARSDLTSLCKLWQKILSLSWENFQAVWGVVCYDRHISFQNMMLGIGWRKDLREAREMEEKLLCGMPKRNLMDEAKYTLGIKPSGLVDGVILNKECKKVKEDKDKILTSE